MIRTLKTELLKKDKYITKKNFCIQALLEKIEILKRSNKSLFKELDHTIPDISEIKSNRVDTPERELVEQYLNEAD